MFSHLYPGLDFKMELTEDLKIKVNLAALIHHCLDQRGFMNVKPFIFSEAMTSKMVIGSDINFDGAPHGMFSITLEDPMDTTSNVSVFLVCVVNKSTINTKSRNNHIETECLLYTCSETYKGRCT